MMSGSTFVADTQLARALGALEQCEQEKRELQRLLHEAEERLKELTKRTSKLEATKEEVRAILCVFETSTVLPHNETVDQIFNLNYTLTPIVCCKCFDLQQKPWGFPSTQKP